MLPQLRLIGQPRPVRPRRLELLCRFDRAPFARRDDGEKVTLTHDLDEAVHAGDRAFVDANKVRSDCGRPHDPRVHHPRNAKVLHEHEFARDFRGNVDARNRASDEAITRGIEQWRLCVQRQLEALAVQELAVRNALPVGPTSRVRHRPRS